MAINAILVLRAVHAVHACRCVSLFGRHARTLATDGLSQAPLSLARDPKEAIHAFDFGAVGTNVGAAAREVAAVDQRLGDELVGFGDTCAGHTEETRGAAICTCAVASLAARPALDAATKFARAVAQTASAGRACAARPTQFALRQLASAIYADQGRPVHGLATLVVDCALAGLVAVLAVAEHTTAPPTDKLVERAAISRSG